MLSGNSLYPRIQKKNIYSYRMIPNIKIIINRKELKYDKTYRNFNNRYRFFA